MTNLDKTMAQNEHNEDYAQENEAEETVNQEQHEEVAEENNEVEELRKKLQTLEAQKDHWRKKAQSSKDESKEEPKSSSDLSSRDLLALAKSDVHENDIDEVLEYARFKKMSVAEALQSGVVKTILSDNAELRKSAEAANTRQVRKGAVKVTSDKLLSDLSKGEVPESKEDAERLFWARKGKSKE